MKELIIGLGIGMSAGIILCKTCKPFADAVDKGVEKVKEITEDVKDEISSATKKNQNKQENEN